MTVAFVGLGSNLDNPVRQVESALGELDTLPQTRLLKRSSLYRTAPVGYADQPDFINAVAQLETELAAERLLEELQAIESRHGRVRTFPNAPRTLDLDLLLFGEVVLRSERLTLPHPRMHERSFVLDPLREIAPDLKIP
ncbi:MAG: 2-amino-4-hydroxy-6-hydroxymethyldihydropteridine diphosphokinase [Betaproteobacteria bacterium]|nr:2-amino-4-hydroxy-6-hydroxymethyldihydropteridine diphosphokinase [Betaproteobacteria bacterium]